MKAPADRTYAKAVADLALALKKGFLSGKLRGWRDGDAYSEREHELPFFIVEGAVEKRFIRHRVDRAALVMTASPSIVAAGEFYQQSGGRPCWESTDLLAVVSAAMAMDVVAHAARMGWTPEARKGAQP